MKIRLGIFAGGLSEQKKRNQGLFMRVIRSYASFGALMVVAALSAPQAAHATVYDWNLSGLDTGSGTITTGAPDSGGFDITSITGTVDGLTLTAGPVGGAGSTPGPVYPGSGGAEDQDGYVIYDNILYPMDPTVFDYNGVLFDLSSGDQGNIGAVSALNYAYLSFNETAGVTAYNPGGDVFSLSAVPEPSSFPILLAGLGMIGGAFYFGRKKQVSDKA